MKILVADDDPVVRFMVEASVRSMGHHVCSCPDGESAWQTLQGFQPQIVVSDWKMPGIDGMELCRRMHTLPSEHAYFILVSSAMGNPQTHEQAAEVGVNAVMPKPLLPQDLFRRIHIAEDAFHVGHHVSETLS